MTGRPRKIPLTSLQPLRRETSMSADEFASTWGPVRREPEPETITRLVLDWVFPRDHRCIYFFTARNLVDERLGPFDDVLIDGRKEIDTSRSGQEPAGQAWNNKFYGRLGFRCGIKLAPAPLAPAFRASFPLPRIDTTIEKRPGPLGRHDKHWNFEADRAAEQGRTARQSVLGVLCRASLTVQSAQDCRWPHARNLSEMTPSAGNELAQRGNDVVLVCPAGTAARRARPIAIRLAYRGSVISDAGNGPCLLRGNRGYSGIRISKGNGAVSRSMDTTFPVGRRKLRLGVANGTKDREREEGDRRMAHWLVEGKGPSRP